MEAEAEAEAASFKKFEVKAEALHAEAEAEAEAIKNSPLPHHWCHQPPRRLLSFRFSEYLVFIDIDDVAVARLKIMKHMFHPISGFGWKLFRIEKKNTFNKRRGENFSYSSETPHSPIIAH